MTRTVINVVAFQGGWLACVLGAANGMPWIGPAVCLPILALHLAWAARPLWEYLDALHPHLWRGGICWHGEDAHRPADHRNDGQRCRLGLLQHDR